MKDIKIIKDRDEKPKGFGYVEFETLDGLKDALTRSGGVSGGTFLSDTLISTDLLVTLFSNLLVACAASAWLNLVGPSMRVIELD